MLNALFIAIFTLTAHQATQIGKRIWENESRGRPEGLTCWNEGEDFASMGINHFIWYPAEKKGPFEETFPALIGYLQKQGVSVPGWLADHPPCPWNSRKEFLDDFHSSKMERLRKFLYQTASAQIQFMAERLDKGFVKILEQANSDKQEHVKKQFERLKECQKGPYILLDYYNFKGDGTSISERYNDQGWGLLQVLEEMSGDTKFPDYEFIKAAEKVLNRRVENAPPDRNEKRWLQGWLNRLKTYG
jgi:hypothetical protein